MASRSVATRSRPAPRSDDRDAGHPSGDERYALLDTAVRRARYAQNQLIELLHIAQEIFGHLDDDVLLYLASQLRLPPSRVYGVATFYHLFVFEPPGAHTCTVCTGTACFVKGGDASVHAVAQAYGVAPGGTSADDQLTLTTARCLGSCGLAPVVVVDGTVRSHQTVETSLEALRAVTAEEAATP